MASKKTNAKVAKKAPAKVAKKGANKTGKHAEKPKEDPLEHKSRGVFNVLDGGIDRSNALGEAIKTSLERRKGRVVDFCPQSELVIETLPLRKAEHIELQWAINNVGIPHGFISVFGQDGLGKSSLVQNWLSAFMEGANAQCCVLVCEGKPLSREWAVRCMSPNRAVAAKMAEAVLIFNLAQLDEMFETWVEALRDPKLSTYVPPTVPIVAVIDPIGKLATKSEASGVYAYAGMDALDEVDMADRGHNWDRAKWNHEFVRKVGLLGHQHNLTVIAVEHQNDQAVGTGKSGPSFLPDWHTKLSHRTKAGGQGLNQVSALQIALADCGNIYSCGEAVARRIIGRAYKNSYGTDTRKFCFALKGENMLQDTDTSLDPGLRWDYTRLEWMMNQSLLGLRKTGSSRATERFSSAELGFTGLSLVEAAAVVQAMPLAVFESLGAKLMIPGFIDVYSTIMKQLPEASELQPVTPTNEP
jgi:hypothetical protein